MAGRILNQHTLLNMYHSVKTIKESSNTNWPICVWVAENSGITWSKNKVKYLKLVLEDDSGKIQAMIYDHVEERSNTFKNEGVNQKYIIRGANVKKTNKKFDTNGHDFELIITNSTIVTPCTITKRSQSQDTEIIQPTSSQAQNSGYSKCQEEVKPKRKLNMNGNEAEALSRDLEALASEDELVDVEKETSPPPPKKRKFSRSVRSRNCKNKKSPDYELQREDTDVDDETYSPTLLQTRSRTPKRILRNQSRVDYNEGLSDNLPENMHEHSTKQESIGKYGKICKRSSTRLQENQDPLEQRRKRKSHSKRGKGTATKNSEAIVIVTDESSDDDFAQPQQRKTPNMKGRGVLEDSDDDDIMKTTIRKKSLSRLSEESFGDFVQHQQKNQMPNQDDEDSEDSEGSEVTQTYRKTSSMNRKGILENSNHLEDVQSTRQRTRQPRLFEQSDHDSSLQQHQKDEDLTDSDESQFTPKHRKTPLKVLEVTDESSGTENDVNSDDESSPQIDSYETIHSHQSSDASTLTSQRSDEESTQVSINGGLSSFSSSFNPSYEDSYDGADTATDETDSDDNTTRGDWPEYDNVKVDYQDDFENDHGKVVSLVYTIIMKAYGDPAVAEDDEKTRDLTTSLMKKINSKRDECVSQAWFKELKTILESKPLFTKYEKTNRGSIEDLKDCEVCKRSGRTTEFRVKLSGIPYDQDTLEPNSEEEEDVMEYLVGRFCYMRIRLYHELYHLRYNIYNDCKRKLQHCRTPDELVKNEAFINKYSRKISKLLRMVEIEIFEDGDKRRRGTRFQREFNENFNYM